MKPVTFFTKTILFGCALLCSFTAFAQTDITDGGGTFRAKYSDSPRGEEIDKLFDNNSRTKYLTFHSEGWAIFEADNAATAVTYSITSGNDAPQRDPKDWLLLGSENGYLWYIIDRRTNEDFPGRGQERRFTVATPGNYKFYKFEADNNSGGILQLAEWKLFADEGPDEPDEPDTDGGWDRLVYPEIIFTDEAPNTTGSRVFRDVIPNPEQTMREMILEIVKELHFNVDDNVRAFTRFTLTLRDYDGVAFKTGSNGVVNIVVSTRHLENVYRNNGQDAQSIKAEILGILSHEGTHGYQYEPRNAGDYRQGTEFFGFIEGVADGVRIVVGRHKTRSPRLGGNWTDGYTTTGFFIFWMIQEKDSNFLRKFQNTARVDRFWSWDGATRSILGEGVQSLWNQYQDWIRAGAPGVPKSLTTSTVKEIVGMEHHSCRLDHTQSPEPTVTALQPTVFPNPTGDIMSITPVTAEDPITIAELYSVTGALLRQFDLTAGQIDVSDFSEGYYVLRTETASGSEASQRLIIQR